MSIFEGCATALVTPFLDDGVDFDGLGHLIDFQIDSGIDALVICGTTGEPATMTADERTEVIDYSIDKIGGRVPVIVGAGSNCTKTAVELSRAAKAAGADALLHVTPFYNKCSLEGLYRHYATIAEATDLPIMVYNVPSRTGVNMTADTFGRLADIETIAAIKEASGNISQIADMARVSSGKADIYSGNDDQSIPVMSLGGKGVISVLSNIMPREMHDMTAAFLAGDIKKATELQLRLKPLMDAMFTVTNPIPVKTALRLMELDKGILRLPLCEMSNEQENELARILRTYELIK